MFEETKKGFDWFSLIVGVLFIIAGIASFTRPDKTLHFLAIVAGIAFIFRGIYELWFRQRIGRILGESSGWLIFSAILDIILGIIFAFAWKQYHFVFNTTYVESGKRLTDPAIIIDVPEPTNVTFSFS